MRYAITPRFCSEIGSLANGIEVKDTNTNVKLKSISLKISPGSEVFLFTIDAGRSVKSGLTVNAQLKRSPSKIALVKGISLDVTAPTIPLSLAEQLANQANVALAKALAQRASQYLSDKPFIAPGRAQSLPFSIGSSKDKIEIISDNGRLLEQPDEFPNPVFVYEGNCRIRPN